jgi:hypothetical protein
MHDLPYGGHRPDGITHCPDGCSRLPKTVSWVRNLNACQTLNGVWTVQPRRPDGCTGTLGSSRTLKSVRTICHYIRTDANLNYSKLLDTDGRPDGKFSSSGQMSVRTVWDVVQTAGREPNFLTWKLCRIFWKLFWIAESLLNSVITMNWFCPIECGQLQTNIYIFASPLAKQNQNKIKTCNINPLLWERRLHLAYAISLLKP